MTCSNGQASTTELLDRMPPHSRQSELALVGCVLLEPAVLSEMGDSLAADDFRDQQLRALFIELAEMHSRGLTIDTVLLVEWLKGRGKLDDIGGNVRIAEAMQAVAVAKHWPSYAATIVEKAARRRVAEEALQVYKLAQGDQTAADILVEKLKGAVERIGAPRIGSAVTIRLSSVKPKKVHWLWTDRFPLGKFSLLAGNPGLGKSLLTTDIAARKTTGTPWPDRPRDRQEPGSVILLTSEDALDDTVRPRLDAAKADVNKVFVLQQIQWYDQDAKRHTKRQFSLERDLAALERAALDADDCRLIIIDPISSYLGKTDSHKNSEVRGVLAPLAELAERLGVAIIGVTHLNKGNGQAIYRSVGSIAFTAAARAVWGVVKDKANPQRRLVLPIKCNLAKDVGGMAYTVMETDEKVPFIAWEKDVVNIDVDDAMAEDGDSRDRAERKESCQWLREALADGPVEARDLENMARAAGHSWRTVKRAKNDAGVISYREGFGRGATWYWRLSSDA